MYMYSSVYMYMRTNVCDCMTSKIFSNIFPSACLHHTYTVKIHVTHITFSMIHTSHYTAKTYSFSHMRVRIFTYIYIWSIYEHEMDDDDNNSNTDVHNNNTEETAGIPEITTEELQTAINKLKKGKSPDSKGIRAEDFKACDEETREMVRQIFNEIIKRHEFTPEDWKKVTIKVIHKKGDVENVSNYRPICSLPAMYKLFSTILYGRLYPVLDQKQAEDQAGFATRQQTTLQHTD